MPPGTSAAPGRRLSWRARHPRTSRPAAGSSRRGALLTLHSPRGPRRSKQAPGAVLGGFSDRTFCKGRSGLVPVAPLTRITRADPGVKTRPRRREHRQHEVGAAVLGRLRGGGGHLGGAVRGGARAAQPADATGRRCGERPARSPTPLPRTHVASRLSRQPCVCRACVQLPCCALMWFGCWSLGTISYNLIKLKECPEAASSLAAEVLAARADLLRKGLDVDAPPPDR